MVTVTLTPADPRHGTINGYNNLYCRCQPCRDANNARQYDYMERHPDQRRKTRDRRRKQEGLTPDEISRLERLYQSRRLVT